MNRLVSDAGPIISAARAGTLDLLRAVVKHLLLPEAVYAEIITQGADKPGANPEIFTDWVEMKTLAHPESTVSLPSTLGKGEREAIVLAEELKAPLLIDDPAGRSEAFRRGLQVIGTLGMLKQAKSGGLIEKVKPVLDEYRTHSFRIKDSLYQAFLQQLDEWEVPNSP